MNRGHSETALLCILESETIDVIVWAEEGVFVKWCMGDPVPYRPPRNVLPPGMVLFPPKTEFQSNNSPFRDIPCLTLDSIFIGQFHDFNCRNHRVRKKGGSDLTKLTGGTPDGRTVKESKGKSGLINSATTVIWCDKLLSYGVCFLTRGVFRYVFFFKRQCFVFFPHGECNMIISGYEEFTETLVVKPITGTANKGRLVGSCTAHSLFSSSVLKTYLSWLFRDERGRFSKKINLQFTRKGEESFVTSVVHFTRNIQRLSLMFFS